MSVSVILENKGSSKKTNNVKIPDGNSYARIVLHIIYSGVFLFIH